MGFLFYFKRMFWFFIVRFRFPSKENTIEVKVDQQTKSNESDKGEKTSVESSFDNKRTKTKDKDGNESASKPLNKPKAPIKEKEESSKKSQSSTTSKATESSKSSKYNPKKNLLI